ncbi:MAG: inorganic diphosphatase [Desulfobacterales bacterium]|nr:inorganic diphosphatase [Desulfobacterales bacterium]
MKARKAVLALIAAAALFCFTLPNALANVTPNVSVLQGEKNYLTGYPALNVDGTVNVVVEIPAGHTAKYEVNKKTGMLELEQKNGKPRFVNYVGYPGNYGMVPRTILPKEQGGDGDPMDVIVLGPSVPIGSVIKARPIGVLNLMDRGEKDFKILMVQDGSPLAACDSVQCLDEKFPGITTIVKTWFTSYKGRDKNGKFKLEAKGFLGKGEAVQLLGDSILAYENARITEKTKIPLKANGNPPLHYWPASKNNGFKYANRPAIGTGELDKLYGTLTLPSYIKYYEVDTRDRIMLNPYLQVATKAHPAILDPEIGVYNYIVNAEGNVAIVQEATHPMGRKYKNGYIRPEDGRKKKVKVKKGKKKFPKEKFGHTSGVAGAVARLGGEILFEDGAWIINNKSGRYSKKNLDRTPEQLANVARLIMDTVDPAGKPWGEIRYRLAYGSDQVQKEYKDSDKVKYLEPKKKQKPYIAVKAAN